MLLDALGCDLALNWLVSPTLYIHIHREPVTQPYLEMGSLQISSNWNDVLLAPTNPVTGVFLREGRDECGHTGRVTRDHRGGHWMMQLHIKRWEGLSHQKLEEVRKCSSLEPLEGTEPLTPWFCTSNQPPSPPPSLTTGVWENTLWHFNHQFIVICWNRPGKPPWEHTSILSRNLWALREVPGDGWLILETKS